MSEKTHIIEIPEEETETDIIEELKDEITTLQSEVVFTAFINVGLRFIGFSQGPDNETMLTYDRTKHHLVFNTLSESYDEFAKNQMTKENG